VSKVYGWIRSGELEAINLAARRGGRPRWKIAASALSNFDQRRSNRVNSVSPRRRRRRSDHHVIEFFR
jgi:hypothetical protein